MPEARAAGAPMRADHVGSLLRPPLPTDALPLAGQCGKLEHVVEVAAEVWGQRAGATRRVATGDTVLLGPVLDVAPPVAHVPNL